MGLKQYVWSERRVWVKGESRHGSMDWMALVAAVQILRRVRNLERWKGTGGAFCRSDATGMDGAVGWV